MRVLCTLPNAAESISGIAFVQTDSGMLSGPIDEATAVRFAAIPGYTVVDDAVDVESVQPEGGDEPAPRRGPGRPRKNP